MSGSRAECSLASRPALCLPNPFFFCRACNYGLCPTRPWASTGKGREPWAVASSPTQERSCPGPPTFRKVLKPVLTGFSVLFYFFKYKLSEEQERQEMDSWGSHRQQPDAGGAQEWREGTGELSQ